MAERKVLANAIRVLSMDSVQKANSGHQWVWLILQKCYGVIF